MIVRRRIILLYHPGSRNHHPSVSVVPITLYVPCFGTNGHPRRDTDVILRQSKAFFLRSSILDSFISEYKVKMMVYDETMTLLWMLDLVLARMSILEEIRT